jgi:CO/xanthine dehydrogenase FAD-binding subunit
VRTAAPFALTSRPPQTLWQVAKQAAARTAGLAALLHQIRWFAGTQIRNVASIGGAFSAANHSSLLPIYELPIFN